MMTRSLSFTALVGAATLLAACGGEKTTEAAPAEAAPAAAPAAPAGADDVDFNMGAPATRPDRSGAQIFAKQCAPCHAAGDDHPGAMQLGATRGAEFAVLEERTDLTSDYVKYIVRHGLNAMPPFKPTAITDVELDKLAAYLAKAD